MIFTVVWKTPAGNTFRLFVADLQVVASMGHQRREVAKRPGASIFKTNS